MFDLAHDFRASVRSFLRRPGYPLVAVGILALGLSASLAVFTYVRAFYQPFPGVDHDGLLSVSVISHEWWQQSFGGDASVLGSTLYLNYRPYTVVGVAAPNYLGVTSSARPNNWIPFAPFRDRYTRWSQQAEDRDIPLVQVYGRLAEGTSPDRAMASLASAAAGLDDAYPRAAESGQKARQLRIENATWIDPRTRLGRDSCRHAYGVAIS